MKASPKSVNANLWLGQACYNISSKQQQAVKYLLTVSSTYYYVTSVPIVLHMWTQFNNDHRQSFLRSNFLLTVIEIYLHLNGGSDHNISKATVGTCTHL